MPVGNVTNLPDGNMNGTFKLLARDGSDDTNLQSWVSLLGSGDHPEMFCIPPDWVPTPPPISRPR